MIRAIVLFIIIVLVSACKRGDFEEHIFIPKDYEGPIYIQYNVKTSKNRVIKSGKNTYLLFLTGNPLIFNIRDPKPGPGYYIEHAYYYSKDNIEEINVDGFIKDMKNPYPLLYGNVGTVNGKIYYVAKDSLSKVKIDSLIKIADEILNERNR